MKRIFFILVSKNTIKIQKFNFLDKICDLRKKSLGWRIICLNEVYILSRTFFDKMYFLCFYFKKTLLNVATLIMNNYFLYFTPTQNVISPGVVESDSQILYFHLK